MDYLILSIFIKLNTGIVIIVQNCMFYWAKKIISFYLTSYLKKLYSLKKIYLY